MKSCTIFVKMVYRREMLDLGEENPPPPPPKKKQNCSLLLPFLPPLLTPLAEAAILDLLFFAPVLAVGTMAFDVRIGLYDDPPNKETVKMIESTKESFRLLGVLCRGLENLLFPFVTTPNYRKYCEVQDMAIEIGQRIIDDKVSELKTMAEEGEEFTKDGGKDCTTH